MTTKIAFSQISAKLPYASRYKGVLSTLHSDIIQHVCDYVHSPSKAYKLKVIKVMNILSYKVYRGDTLPQGMPISKVIESMEDIPDTILHDFLKNIYIDFHYVEWDIPEDNSYHVADESSSHKTSEPINYINKIEPVVSMEYQVNTDKTDLYIKPPEVPQFDYERPWFQKSDNFYNYCIYTTLPEIPTKQNEISCSTDISKMSVNDLIKLFPNTIIHTRSDVFYHEYTGISFDAKLGLLIPIEGFSEDDVRSNILKYPHLYKLSRLIDNKLASFYQNIEIDGQLHKIMDVWDRLPESRIIPRNSEFIKEYVVRRYLLERDIKHIDHKYPMFGALDPHLTLFMPFSDYEEYGYSSAENLARECVLARIRYKQSRNPILRRFGYA